MTKIYFRETKPSGIFGPKSTKDKETKILIEQKKEKY